MGSPASKIDICNMALGFVGEPAIASIDAPSTPTETVVAMYYDNARQTILRKWLWNFSKSRAAIPNTGIKPLFDYSDAYQLPADFIRFISINDVNLYWLDYFQRFYEIVENSTVLYNGKGAPTLQVKYVKDVEDVMLWDKCFQRLVAYQLAIDIAYTITNNKDLLKTMNNLMTQEVPDATSITVQEQPLRRIQRSRAIESRRALGGNSTPGYYVDFGP